MEENKTSIWDEIKRIDLVSYLDSIGHQPKLIRNSDYWYNSPFRQEKTPSLRSIVSEMYGLIMAHAKAELSLI